MMREKGCTGDECGSFWESLLLEGFLSARLSSVTGVWLREMWHQRVDTKEMFCAGRELAHNCFYN